MRSFARTGPGPGGVEAVEVLFADATALIALGEMGRIDLLRSYDPVVVIGPAVEAELIRSRAQVATARTAGWLRIRHPNQAVVSTTRPRLGLDVGEAEIIVLASMLAGHRDTALMDERRAFRILLRPSERHTIRGGLVCLAQVLHTLEERGEVPSAAALMQAMLDSDAYAWAADVREHYEAWCRVYAKVPLPGVRASG